MISHSFVTHSINSFLNIQDTISLKLTNNNIPKKNIKKKL